MTTWMEDAIRETPLNVSDPIQFGAEEYWCAMKLLDELGVPREYAGNTLSIVGRIRVATDTFITSADEAIAKQNT